MTSPDEIRELERLLDLADPGVWAADHVQDQTAIISSKWPMVIVPHGHISMPDALIAAAAVNALPSLLSALATAQARIKELERDLNDQLKVESDRDAEISVERQRRMTAELQNGRDAARIRDLEARIKELEAENARLRADVEGYQDYIDSGADR
jgi:hypothetical protein